jgi:hypothetical protein
MEEYRTREDQTEHRKSKHDMKTAMGDVEWVTELIELVNCGSLWSINILYEKAVGYKHEFITHD